MCDRCGWRETVAHIGDALKTAGSALQSLQREWFEAIRVTVDDNRHVTDHQKAVVRRILRERDIGIWKAIPKATDRTTWSDAKRERVRARRRVNRAYDRYGRF